MCYIKLLRMLTLCCPRVLYDNLVSLVYDTYTSHVKFTVQVTEGLEEKLISSGALPTSDQFRTLLDNDYIDTRESSSS